MFFSAFPGGIHPPENKHTKKSGFSNLPVPPICYIPLKQHIGAPALPLVKPGDIVEEGQLIGEASEALSANVHSSVPGSVVEIKEMPTVFGAGSVVVIESGGSFNTSQPPAQPPNVEDFTKDEILKAVHTAGIVGLGGASFPTAVKLSPPQDSNVDTFLVNGSECEPYLTADDMLMNTFPSEIITGVRLAMRAIGVNKAIIGVEDNKSGAAAALKKALKELNPPEDISVKLLRTKYPQGAEKQLIYSLTKRKVPAGGLPFMAGVIVQNVSTVFAIHGAVLMNKPLYERYATVSGSLVRNPGNYKIRAGTSLRDVAESCGGLTGDPAKIIIGGPMCGISVTDMSVSVVKSTSGILFLSKDDVYTGRDYAPCIRCGHCVSVCPIGLLPCDVARAAEKFRFDLINALHPFDCVMCGSCAFRCPSLRPLPHFIMEARERIIKAKQAATDSSSLETYHSRYGEHINKEERADHA
ncbi:MAG: electron transport complex subunit RsxC [Leptospirales bacterium]|nr:electron transport complex subunit RsxC [Leptospirales bacterium]